MSNDATSDPTPENPTPKTRHAHVDTTAEVAPSEPPRLWRGVTIVAVAFALIATVLSAWSLLRPAKSTTAAPVTTTAPTFTDQQIADARTRACDAFKLAATAVTLQTHADPGNEPQGGAANARLSTLGGGTFLLTRLDPATPPPLTAEIHSFGNLLQDIGLNQLAGVQNEDPVQTARYNDAGAAEQRIVGLCK